MAGRLSTHICPRFQVAVDILGRRWTGLILRALQDGPRRFGELTRHIEVVSERMLSERLKELERDGLVVRKVIPSTPVHVEYSLTDKGAALREVLAAIERWAGKWVEPDAPAEKPRRQARAAR
jgi:DNA-binding HxlR family transcriptional regulator